MIPICSREETRVCGRHEKRARRILVEGYYDRGDLCYIYLQVAMYRKEPYNYLIKKGTCIYLYTYIILYISARST